MLKQRSYLLFISTCLSLTVALSGCQHSTDPTKAISTNSTDATADSSSKVIYNKSEFILPPGATSHIVKTDLSKLNNVSFVSSQPQMITVDTHGVIKVSVDATIGTKATITSSYKQQTTACTIIVKYSLLDTITANTAGKKVVTNPEAIAVVVNKQRALPETYIPTDLVEPQIPYTFKAKVEKRLLRGIAATALEKLVAGAEKDNLHLFGVSGYRSYKTQRAVFAGNVQDKGTVEANKISAVPGQSEHQTGLAIDLTNNVPADQLLESFGHSKEGIWLAAHAADYGFIIRYLKGKEPITGYAYEPWHIRYVGLEIAKDIYARKITFEEYFDDATPVQGSN